MSVKKLMEDERRLSRVLYLRYERNEP